MPLRERRRLLERRLRQEKLHLVADLFTERRTRIRQTIELVARERIDLQVRLCANRRGARLIGHQRDFAERLVRQSKRPAARASHALVPAAAPRLSRSYRDFQGPVVREFGPG